MTGLSFEALSIGIICALSFGLGLNMLLWTSPITTSRSFADRIAAHTKPIMRDLSDERERTFSWGILYELMSPLILTVQNFSSKVGMGDHELEKKLDQAGEKKTLAQFRNQQILFGVSLMGVAILLNILLGIIGRNTVSAAVIFTVVALVGGFYLPVQVLGSKIAKREKRILAEFPTTAELIALAVSAGDSMLAALDRTAQNSQGLLSEELESLVGDIHSGTSLSEGLNQFAKRIPVTPVQRFVEGIVVALERGTPLADVVRAQAQDARDVSKRELMETAGKKEIAMLAPVVFGLLPLTIIFAIYPGLALITLNF